MLIKPQPTCKTGALKIVLKAWFFSLIDRPALRLVLLENVATLNPLRVAAPLYLRRLRG